MPDRNYGTPMTGPSGFFTIMPPPVVDDEPDLTYRAIDGKAFVDYKGDTAAGQPGPGWVRCRFPDGMDGPAGEKLMRWRRCLEITQESIVHDGVDVVAIVVTMAEGSRFALIIEPLGPAFEPDDAFTDRTGPAHADLNVLGWTLADQGDGSLELLP